MEMMVFAGALVALDVMAYFFGHDSRQASTQDHHDRALEAIRRGDFAVYEGELAAFEGKILKDVWQGF
jgi:hypothetical protein